MTGRYAAPELLALGPPPKLASRDYETALVELKAKIVFDMQAIGLPYDMQMLETDSGVVLGQASLYLDTLRRTSIDDAIAQTYLGSATGAFLDARAEDYGVLRRSLPHGADGVPPVARPADVPPLWTWDADAQLWREDDESLRTVAFLAWGALSVAGPADAYAYHAAIAHPAVFAAATNVIGPETGIVEPGEVLIVLQSTLGDGVPAIGVLEAVAARLDAFEIIDGDGVSTLRPVRDRQSVRPLGARVTVQACQPIAFDVAATLYLSPGPDPEAIRLTALARLDALLARKRRIGTEVPRSGLIAAIHVAGADGLPVADEVALAAPAADVEPSHLELATVGTVTLDVVLR